MNPEYNHELPALSGSEHASQQVAEALAAAPESRTAPGPAVPIPAVPAIPLPAAAPTDSPPVPASAGSNSPAIADDTDLIEKEWVEKAKQIVEQTRTEPYEQKREVSRLQADYLQKRYNKTIQLDEE